MVDKNGHVINFGDNIFFVNDSNNEDSGFGVFLGRWESEGGTFEYLISYKRFSGDIEHHSPATVCEIEYATEEKIILWKLEH